MECRKSNIQEYQCQVKSNTKIGKEVAFDACLAKEIFWLWDKGIETIGSCCGKHRNANSGYAGYIQVLSKHIDEMEELGYTKDKSYGFEPCNCFEPKTILEVV